MLYVYQCYASLFIIMHRKYKYSQTRFGRPPNAWMKISCKRKVAAKMDGPCKYVLLHMQR